MLMLAIDTSTPAVTVALHDGRRPLAESTTVDARRHTELVAAAIDSVLAQAHRDVEQLTHVVVGVGPGPFTGLRVGLVSARVLAFARGIPVGGLCSLDILAHQAWQEHGDALGQSLVVATDARRKEVYSARYAVSGAGIRRVSEPAVGRPGQLAAELDGARVVGRGALLYREELDPSGLGADPLDVSAASLADLAASTTARGGVLLSPDPMYLRRPDIMAAAPRKPVLS